MDATLVGGLLVLALIDSTRIGTLVIPIWLLLSATRPRVRRLLGYLATIAGFYLVVGVGLVLVADAGLQRFGDLANRPAVLWLQLLVGVGLFALSWRYDSGRRRKRGEPDRATRWRARVLHDQDPLPGAGPARRNRWGAGAADDAALPRRGGAAGQRRTVPGVVPAPAGRYAS
jgi:hypothetical protein